MESIDKIKRLADIVSKNTAPSSNTNTLIGNLLKAMALYMAEQHHGAVGGYQFLNSLNDLPTGDLTDKQKRTGYVIGENIYFYVGTDGDTLDGEYQNGGSFHGTKGDDGLSAYEIWKAIDPNNANKTEAEFLASLRKSGFSSEGVLTRPTTNIDTKTIYCIPSTSDNNVWTEEIYKEGHWIVLATHQGGLSAMLNRLNRLHTESELIKESVLKTSLVRGNKIVASTHDEGTYIDTDGSIGTTGAAQFVVDTYQVTPNVIYNIDFNVGGFSAYNRAWGVAYDSNDNVVEVFGILPKQSDATTDDDKIRRKTYIVPDNVTKVRFGFNTDFDGYANVYLTKEYNIQGKISDVEGEIEKITIAKDEEIEATNIVDKKVLQPSGDVYSINTSGYVVATFGVVAGNTYCIDYHTDSLGLTQRAWGAVYDDNDNVIEVLGLLKTGNDETVTDDDKNFTRYCRIPQSATKLRLGYNNGHSTESKLYSTTKIEEIGQKVKESEDSVAKIEELSNVVSENTHIADAVLSYANRLDNNAIRTDGGIVSFSGQQGYYVDTFNVLPNTIYYIDYATFKVGANKRLWGAVYKVVNGEDVMIHALGELPVASDNPTSDELVHKVFYTTPADAQKIKLSYHPDNNTASTISTVKEFNIPQKIMEIEQAASGGDNVSQTIIVNPKIDLRKSNLKVLHIGNSFMAGATTYLSQFVNAASIDVSDMCLYLANRSSGSFKSWYNTYHDADTSGYSITKCIGGLDLNTEIGITTGTGGNNGSFAAGDGSGFRNALVNVKWDLIIIQQVSSYSGEYDGWEGSGSGGYLKEFLRIIRTYQPQASLGWHLCHASPNQSPDGTYARYLQIVSATKKMASRYGIDFIIPYGTAIENLRISSLNTTPNQFTFDNHHLAHGLAQYVANASYFQALIAPRYGISVLGNSLRITVPQSTKNTYPDYVNNFVDVDDSNYYEAQMCAILAANNMYERINPDGIEL